MGSSVKECMVRDLQVLVALPAAAGAGMGAPGWEGEVLVAAGRVSVRVGVRVMVSVIVCPAEFVVVISWVTGAFAGAFGGAVLDAAGRVRVGVRVTVRVIRVVCPTAFVLVLVMTSVTGVPCPTEDCCDGAGAGAERWTAVADELDTGAGAP